MKVLTRQCFLAVVMMCSLLVVGQKTDTSRNATVEKEVIALRDKWLAAEKGRDIATLKDVFKDDFVVGTSQGDVLSKDQLLARIQSPDREVEELRSDNTEVRLYGNVAILTDHTTIRGRDHGHAFGGEFRYVRVFVKSHGRWQVALAQAAPLPTPPANN
jgi:ketosteroid isomerase-like protein